MINLTSYIEQSNEKDIIKSKCLTGFIEVLNKNNKWELYKNKEENEYKIFFYQNKLDEKYTLEIKVKPHRIRVSYLENHTVKDIIEIRYDNFIKKMIPNENN